MYWYTMDFELCVYVIDNYTVLSHCTTAWHSALCSYTVCAIAVHWPVCVTVLLRVVALSVTVSVSCAVVNVNNCYWPPRVLAASTVLGASSNRFGPVVNKNNVG